MEELLIHRMPEPRSVQRAVCPFNLHLKNFFKRLLTPAKLSPGKRLKLVLKTNNKNSATTQHSTAKDFTETRWLATLSLH